MDCRVLGDFMYVCSTLAHETIQDALRQCRCALQMGGMQQSCTSNSPTLVTLLQAMAVLVDDNRCEFVYEKVDPPRDTAGKMMRDTEEKLHICYLVLVEKFLLGTPTQNRIVEFINALFVRIFAEVGIAQSQPSRH